MDFVLFTMMENKKETLRLWGENNEFNLDMINLRFLWDIQMGLSKPLLDVQIGDIGQIPRSIIGLNSISLK